MHRYFTQCVSCNFPVNASAKAICLTCESSLITSPPLCPQCGSPVCLIQTQASCTRPWLARMNEEGGGIQSYSARYLMLGQGYTVLKKWKLRRGPIFDRQVLLPEPRLIQLWNQLSAEAIVPVPQHFFRSWKVRGSPVEIISNWVHLKTKLPVKRLLEMAPTRMAFSRQAQRSLGERLSSPRNRFSLSQNVVNVPKQIILIDDFMTTGRTLNEAAEALRNAGVVKIHAFCLGVRTFTSIKK